MKSSKSKLTAEDKAAIAAETDGGSDAILSGHLRELATDDLDPEFTVRVMRQIDRRTTSLWARFAAVIRRDDERRVSVGTTIPVGLCAALLSFVAVWFLAKPADVSATTDARPVGDLLTAEFTMKAPNASKVTLSGDFNKWATDTIPLADRDKDGVWSVKLSLRPGSYGYVFVVDGVAVTDPRARASTAGPHGRASVLRL